MITLNNFYLVFSPVGNRITKAISQDPNTGDFYGSISPSNYEIKGDNESIGFNTAIREATEEEKNAWLEWYNIEESI